MRLCSRKETIIFLTCSSSHNLKGLRLKSVALAPCDSLDEIPNREELNSRKIERAAVSWSNDTEFTRPKKAGLRTAYKLQVLALDFLLFTDDH